jgi:hypothetical protein
LCPANTDINIETFREKERIKHHNQPCFYLFLPVIHSPSGTVWTIRWISSICESILGKRIVWNTAKSGWTTECLKEQNSLKRTEKGQMEDLSSIFENKT